MRIFINQSVPINILIIRIWGRLIIIKTILAKIKVHLITTKTKIITTNPTFYLLSLIWQLHQNNVIILPTIINLKNIHHIHHTINHKKNVKSFFQLNFCILIKTLTIQKISSKKETKSQNDLLIRLIKTLKKFKHNSIIMSF